MTSEPDLWHESSDRPLAGLIVRLMIGCLALMTALFRTETEWLLKVLLGAVGLMLIIFGVIALLRELLREHRNKQYAIVEFLMERKSRR